MSKKNFFITVLRWMYADGTSFDQSPLSKNMIHRLHRQTQVWNLHGQLYITGHKLFQRVQLLDIYDDRVNLPPKLD